MAILEVLTFPDPRLRKLSLPIDDVNGQLVELVEFSKDLLDTMYEERGIGLSAPQVNRLQRIITVDARPTDKEGRYGIKEMTELEQKLKYPLVFFNPEVIEKEGESTFDEGCLSVPGYYETVKRFKTIKVKALNQEGKEVNFIVDGLTSICIQHEIDHLDGKLFIDRLSLIKSNRIKSKIKKFGYPSKSDAAGDSKGVAKSDAATGDSKSDAAGVAKSDAAGDSKSDVAKKAMPKAIQKAMPQALQKAMQQALQKVMQQTILGFQRNKKRIFEEDEN